MFEGDYSEKVEIFGKLEAGKYIDKSFQIGSNDQTKMQTYMSGLRNAGLDLGRGNCEYGFKMPLPATDTSMRTLRIFRRYVPAPEPEEESDVEN